jgi:hypothetical protein
MADGELPAPIVQVARGAEIEESLQDIRANAALLPPGAGMGDDPRGGGGSGEGIADLVHERLSS